MGLADLDIVPYWVTMRQTLSHISPMNVVIFLILLLFIWRRGQASKVCSYMHHFPFILDCI